jgi:flagellar basal body-associated protein FliL
LEGKGIFFILLVIVAILTLSLALMAGYLFLVADTGRNNNPHEGTVEEQVKVPGDNELDFYQLYSDKTNFNLKKDEEGNIHIIQLTAKLKYFKKVKGIKNIPEKLALYDSDIKELIGTYFQSVSIDEVSDRESKERIKKDLTKKINELLVLSEESKKDMVYDIIFDMWFYQ